MPERIQLSRKKGWRMPPNTVKVDRRTRFGNPFDLRRSEHCWTALAHGFKGDAAGRLACSIAMFRAWLKHGRAVQTEACGLYIGENAATVEAVALSPDLTAPAPPSLDEIRQSLAGKNLACWCPLDQPCHADVLLELANAPDKEG